MRFTEFLQASCLATALVVVATAPSLAQDPFADPSARVVSGANAATVLPPERPGGFLALIFGAGREQPREAAAQPRRPQPVRAAEARRTGACPGATCPSLMFLGTAF